MNIDDLAEVVSDKVDGITKGRAREAIAAAFEEIGDAMWRDEEVNIPGFAKFSAKFKEEHPGRNPHSGESITVAAKTVPVFKPLSALKEKVNAPKKKSRERRR